MNGEMRESETGISLFNSAEAARDAVTQAGNRTLEALQGHLSQEKRSYYEKVLENLNGARVWFSRNGLRMTSSLALAATFLTSCAPVVVAPVIPNGGGTGSRSTEASPTTIPSATATEPPTVTATVTEAKIEEHDLKPMYTETVSQEFMGVKINSELITDESLDPLIKKVTVPEKTYAEFIARTIFKVWWSKGDSPHTGTPTEDDFKAFMVLWSHAQKTNDPADWKNVELNNIWANDLNDGNGYVQKPYTVWPMYNEGRAPKDVFGLEKIALALVSSSWVNNVTKFQNNAYDQGFGTNIDKGSIFVYAGMPNDAHRTGNVTLTLSNIAWWLSRNTGGSISGYTPDDSSFSKLLSRGGLTSQ